MKHHKEHHKHHEMIDNRHVHSSRMEGISRVMQRKGDLHKGQGGKMGMKPEEEAHWRRGDSLTPRGA